MYYFYRSYLTNQRSEDGVDLIILKLANVKFERCDIEKGDPDQSPLLLH